MRPPDSVLDTLARAIDPSSARAWSRGAMAETIHACGAWDLAPEAVTGWQSRARIPPAGLPPMVLLRASALLGIDRALRIVFGESDQAIRWLGAPNSGPAFGGRSPREVMERDGLAGLLRVRAHLDAWRGGAWSPPIEGWAGEAETRPIRMYGA